MRNLRWILTTLLAGAAIGVLAFLLRMTQSVDADLHLERLADIRAINNLDVDLNRAVTQARVSSMIEENSEIETVTRKLGTALDAIDKGPRSLRGLSPQLDKALDSFLETIEDKFELDHDFEERSAQLNLRLVNSMDGAPVSADEAVALAAPAIREHVRGLVNQVKTELTTFGVTPTPTNGPAVKGLLDQLDQLGANQPQAFRDGLQKLRRSADDLMTDKGELVGKLNEFLGRPTGPQLQAVEQAYTVWYQSQVAVANGYRLLLVAYAAILLLSLAGLGLRLRRSYLELDRAHDDLVVANETLEDQVRSRTRDLSTALDDLRASQAQLVQSEKMASLGQMVAGVAHEINTPLGYARSNTEIVRNALAEIRGLATAQDKALGMIHTPGHSDEEVAAALAEAQARREAVDPGELMGDLEGLLRDADHGLTQIGELVTSLKDFSRLDRSRTDQVDVNNSIDAALKICQNQLKHRVEVVRQYGRLPVIECAPSQLNQVFLNIFTNAAQAIEDKGKIYVHTAAEADGVAVRILDTGCGMTEEVRKHIFEPFFTTKPVGKGTGLGLSIVYRIVEEHGGRIEVRSTPGKGSEFILHLPAKQAPAPTVAAAEPAAAMA